MLGLLVLVVGSVTGGCGDDYQEIVDQFCAKWEQCVGDMGLDHCYIEDFLADCDNDDELVDHFEGCLELSCDELSTQCFMVMPPCDHASSGGMGWLPWLPKEDVEVPTPTPGPSSAP